MNLIEEPQSITIEESKRVYLQRVNQLYQNIQDWLKNDDLVRTQSKIEIAETLGEYVVPTLAIQTAAGEELATLKPVGADVLLVEGMIEVTGWLDHDYVLYLLAGGPTFLDPTRIKHPYYKGIGEEGWYWINRLNTHPLRLNSSSLLQLITWVSDHEF